MNNPQVWQAVAAVIAAYAALLGGLYAIVTRPIQSQLTDIIRRLERIETKQDDHSQGCGGTDCGTRKWRKRGAYC
jgi:hypothetical protein